MKHAKPLPRLALIGTAGVPGKYGGFETLAHQMVTYWAGMYELTVYCSSTVYGPEERKRFFAGARRIFLPLRANGPQGIIYDMISIIHALFYADYLLIFGVSGGILLPLVRLISRKKLIVNIDGLEWKRGKCHPLARRFLEISEYFAIRYSHADITDNTVLRFYTGKRYGTISRLIEYGGDHVFPVEIRPEDLEIFPFIGDDYAFSVCRIEPENNIHRLLAAFEALAPRRLVLVGNWDESDYGRSLRERYKNLPNLTLADPIYEPETLNLLRSNCQVYLHGHSVGGTNPSLVEAMYLGLPVLAYDVPYNRETTQGEAAYFRNSTELIQLIRNLGPPDYARLGAAMKAIARQRYTWEIVFRAYETLFRSLEHGYKKARLKADISRLRYSTLERHQIAHLAYYSNGPEPEANYPL
ncbi:MAG: DUF1972 domain-containing protein [Bacteroidia bacterium]|nr:DUF1972 domain-containing protein [Bacteroidia bacterium]